MGCMGLVCVLGVVCALSGSVGESIGVSLDLCLWVCLWACVCGVGAGGL
jgi:hypothetical protein